MAMNSQKTESSDSASNGLADSAHCPLGALPIATAATTETVGAVISEPALQQQAIVDAAAKQKKKQPTNRAARKRRGNDKSGGKLYGNANWRYEL